MPQSKSDTHITPDEVFDVINEIWHIPKWEMFDPCPVDSKTDGLTIPWRPWNFVNPPYARLKGDKETMLHKFVFKAVHESILGHKSIMLLPSKTDQGWFHYLIRMKYDKYWFDHRLKFKGNKWSATQPHFLVKVAN